MQVRESGQPPEGLLALQPEVALLLRFGNCLIKDQQLVVLRVVRRGRKYRSRECRTETA